MDFTLIEVTKLSQQLVLPTTPWKVIEKELRQTLAPVSEAMHQDAIGTTEAVQSLSLHTSKSSATL